MYRHGGVTCFVGHVVGPDRYVYDMPPPGDITDMNIHTPPITTNRAIHTKEPGQRWQQYVYTKLGLYRRNAHFSSVSCLPLSHG